MNNKKIYYNFEGTTKNIVREIYQLPNKKQYLKIDIADGTQIHVQVDFNFLNKLMNEASSMLSRML